MKYNSKNVYTFQKYECYYKFTHERINACITNIILLTNGRLSSITQGRHISKIPKLRIRKNSVLKENMLSMLGDAPIEYGDDYSDANTQLLYKRCIIV